MIMPVIDLNRKKVRTPLVSSGIIKSTRARKALGNSKSNSVLIPTNAKPRNDKTPASPLSSEEPAHIMVNPTSKTNVPDFRNPPFVRAIVLNQRRVGTGATSE